MERAGFEDRLPNAASSPSEPSVVDRAPFAHFLGQVAPRSSGLSDPEDGVDECAQVWDFAAAGFDFVFFGDDDWPQGGPLLVGEAVAIGDQGGSWWRNGPP